MKPVIFKVTTDRGDVRVVLEWPAKAAAWYYRFKLPQRKRDCESTGTRDVRQARKVAEEAVRAASRIAPTNVCDLAKMSEGYLAYMKAQNKKKNSIGNVRPKLLRLMAFTGPLNLAPISEADMTELIRKYLDQREVGITTRKNERVVLSGFMSWLITERHVTWRVNPASGKLFKRQKAPTKIRPIVDKSVLPRLLDAARPTDLYPAVVLMLSGLRPISTDRLQWECVDLEHKTIQVLDEKSNPRKFALGAWAVKELSAWREAHPNRPLTLGKDRTHRELRVLRQMAGIPDTATLGALRRTADFRLYESGITPQEAGKLMDHSPATAQRHYVEWRALDSTAAAAALDFSPDRQNNRQKKRQNQS